MTRRTPRAPLSPDPRRMAIATRAIHGRRLAAFRGPVAEPIVQTSAYRFADSSDAIRYAKGDPSVLVYSRYHNPTVARAEENLALMLNAERVHLFSSGMAAITAALHAATRAGDSILSTPALYGGTYRLFRDILPRHGVRVRYLPLERPDRVAELVDRTTRVLYLESPTNPTLRLADIGELVRHARAAERRTRRRILVMADNTFATVLNQDPFRFGVDVVLESATKYLGGHTDLLAGVVAGSAPFLADVHTQLKYHGGCADPFAAYLLLRSLKTFELRLRRQNENAIELAAFLEQHPRVRRVLYPGLPSHPQHALARRQMSGFGGMVTIEVPAGARGAVRVCNRLRIALNAMSLGGVETLVSIPVYSSHVGMSPRELARHGVTPGMIRISVGVEGIEDLKRDFAQALGTA